jgi:hypothetical protein
MGAKLAERIFSIARRLIGQFRSRIKQDRFSEWSEDTYVEFVETALDILK